LHALFVRSPARDQMSAGRGVRCPTLLLGWHKRRASGADWGTLGNISNHALFSRVPQCRQFLPGKRVQIDEETWTALRVLGILSANNHGARGRAPVTHTAPRLTRTSGGDQPPVNGGANQYSVGQDSPA
jgi:hypothetical protein